MPDMSITGPGKLLLLVVWLVCTSVFVVTGDIDPALWIAVNGPLVGIGIGNGLGARKGQSAVPMIGARNDEGTITVHVLTPADVARRDELLGKLAALDEAERRELQELVRRSSS